MYWGDSVYARVKAINIVGESQFSDIGNGANMITSPDAPINVQNDFPNSHMTQITLTWEDGLEDGGTEVVDYRILYSTDN